MRVRLDYTTKQDITKPRVGEAGGSAVGQSLLPRGEEIPGSSTLNGASIPWVKSLLTSDSYQSRKNLVSSTLQSFKCNCPRSVAENWCPAG